MKVSVVYSFVFACRSPLVRGAIILLNQLESHPAPSKLTLNALLCGDTVTSIGVAAQKKEKKNPIERVLLQALVLAEYQHGQLFRAGVFPFLNAARLSLAR